MARNFLSAASRAFSTAFRLFGGINVETIVANKTLDFASSNVQVLNPSTGSRDINLMLLEGTGLGCRTDGLPFLIKNSGSGGHDLVVKDSAGSTVTTIDQGQWALVMGDGASWRVVVNPTVSMLSIATDVITESTAGAGVTVDGALLKDGDFRPVDSDGVIFGTGADITMTWDGTRFTVTQAAPNSAVEWGVDGAGIDHVFYGDTASAKITWDQSADTLLLEGVAKIKAQTIAAATGTAIPVTHSGSFPVTQNGAETNTLADPTFIGQWLNIFVDTDTSGARVITAASRINQAANTVITLTDVGDFIKLEAITIAGALKWQVVANDGAALS
jgi:hypothetical protein